MFDIRSEKVFRIGTARLTGFFDVYNIFNTNAEQDLTKTRAARSCARSRSRRRVWRVSAASSNGKSSTLIDVLAGPSYRQFGGAKKCQIPG